MSLAIAGVILVGTWGLLRIRRSGAGRRAARGSTAGAVEALLARPPGVREMHDLHIWAMSTTETALTAHLVRPGGRRG